MRTSSSPALQCPPGARIGRYPVDRGQRLIRRARWQPALDGQPHRVVDRDVHDARVAVDPSVLMQQRLLADAQVHDVLAWEALQARLGRHTPTLAERQWVLRRLVLDPLLDEEGEQ